MDPRKAPGELFWPPSSPSGSSRMTWSSTLEGLSEPGRVPGAIFNDFGSLLGAPGAFWEHFRVDFGVDFCCFGGRICVRLLFAT